MDDNIVSKSIKSILNFGFKIVSLWFKLWLLPINSVFEWVLERVKPVLDPLFSFFNTHKAKLLKYSLLSIFYLIFLLFVTTLSYYAIYSTLVPKVSTEEPLFFDYSFKSTKKIVADVQASVEFQKSKHYNIYLELELPESPKNQEIGMFMACMDIDDHDKWNPQKIHHTCRPAILKYTSSLLKSMKNVLYAIPYLFGIYEEKQIIILPMGENFIANRFYQTISASIQINNPEIQIYRASLKFLANLNGFDYYLYYYPILSFIIGCSIIYTSLLFASVFVVASLYLYRHFNSVSSVEEFEEYEGGIGSHNEDDNVSVPDNEDILVGDESDVESYVNNNNNDAVPIISIPRRNGATSTISTQKRKPIWDQINDIGDNNVGSSSSSGNIISGSSFNNKGDDSLGIFTSPIQKSKQSSSSTYENSQFYKDLDEAFSQSVSKTTTTDSYSWDIDNSNSGNNNNNNKQNKSTSPLIRSINNNNYNANNINFGKTPSSPPPPMVKNSNHGNNDDDLLESPRSMNPHLILSTNTTAVQPLDQEQTLTTMVINLATDNNYYPQQSPIPTQQPLQLDDENKINDDDNDDKEETDEKDSEQLPPHEEFEISTTKTTTTTTTICESDSNNSNSSSTEESDNEETAVADSEGSSSDDQVEEAGNSGYANEEWVKIKDSSVRKRKN